MIIKPKTFTKSDRRDPHLRPTVAAIMLVNGRHDMVERAIRSFHAQTYPIERRRLILWDTGSPRYSYPATLNDGLEVWNPNVDGPHFAGVNIGTLRNAANKYADHHYTMAHTKAEIFAHWDSDDWYSPGHIEGQVNFLEQSKAACVGYHSVLFQDSRNRQDPPEVFEYRHQNGRYCIGASMVYWCEAWRHCKFHETEPHEDNIWWMKNAGHCDARDGIGRHDRRIGGAAPRMICSIHGGNTSLAYRPALMRRPEWERWPEIEAAVAGVMNMQGGHAR